MRERLKKREVSIENDKYIIQYSRWRCKSSLLFWKNVTKNSQKIFYATRDRCFDQTIIFKLKSRCTLVYAKRAVPDLSLIHI